jgi:hypothetical protein
VLGETLGRIIGSEVLGMSVGRTLGRSLGDTLGNEVLGFSLGNIERLGYVLGSDDGIWPVSGSSPAPGDKPESRLESQPLSESQSGGSSILHSWQQVQLISGAGPPQSATMLVGMEIVPATQNTGSRLPVKSL